MKKNIFKIFIVAIITIFLSACLDKDNFTDRYVYTTIFPIEYATKMIYGEYSNVSSIYPDGTSISDFSMTDKMVSNYSKGNKFIYNGLSDEGLIARDLLNNNNNLEIVDAMKGMNYSNQVEELWLDPSNFLMICRNIKSTLIDYEENVYIKENIEKNYQSLKESISIIDVSIYELSKNGNYKTILVTNNVFNYLSKYGITVLSLDPNNTSIDKSISEAKKLISSGKIKYVYSLKGDSVTDSLNTFLNDNRLSKIEIDSFSTISDEERINGETYLSLMNNIIDQLKQELFK